MRDKSRLAGKLLLQLNAMLAKAFLAIWPDENKAWGVAFASESAAIDSPLKQLHWLLDGIPVLFRENFRSFVNSLGRPIGVGPADLLGDQRSPGGRAPRTPRIVLALLSVLLVTLLAQPASRAVFRSVSEAYTESGWDPSKWSEVRRVQSLAEKNLTQKNQDSQLLAFASLLYSDEGKRLSLADAAIRSNPGLMWIDFENVVLPRNDTTKQHPLPLDRVKRLISSDPDNAFLHLLQAESIAATFRRVDAENDPNALHAATWGSAASRDPQWLAAMDAAFKAPHYDAYDRKLFLLSRDVVERYSINDPRIFSAMLGRRPVYQYVAIDAYSKLLLSRASDAQSAGDTKSAIEHCSVILDFAQHLRYGNFYSLETWAANDVESRTYPRLQAVSQNSGQHQLALEIASGLRQNRDERSKLASGMRPHSRTRFPYWSGSEWRAVLMQSSVFSIWILAPLSLVSVPALWLVRRRLRVTSGTIHSFLCLLADLCPVVLAVASAVLFLAYAPVAAACRQVLRGPFSPASYAEFSQLVYAPFSLPMSVQSAFASFSGPNGRFLLCPTASAILILLVVHILVRHLRTRAHSE